MGANERTHLLARTESNSSDCSESRDREDSLKNSDQKFALWQIGALFGILLANADTSLVWATHETVASHFDNLENSSWIMTTFSIGYCVTLPLYGHFSNNYGCLRPLVAAYGTFCVGCSLCGLGQTYWQVILGRIISGCGASGMVSMASIIITDIAAASDVAVLRSYVNIASVVGLSVGGPLGGFLGETIGWKWSFLCQVPVASGCCILIARGIQDYPSVLRGRSTQQYEHSESNSKIEMPTFDYPGAITLALWTSSLLMIIDLQNQISWENLLMKVISVVGALSLLAFIFFEACPGRRQLLIPVRLLKTEVSAFCVGQLLIVGSCHGFVSQISPYFANTQGASDAAAGGQTIPSSIGNAVGNLIAGQIIKRLGSYKKLSLASLFLCIVTSIILILQWSHHITTWEGLTTFPFGLFAGMVLSTQFIGLYHSAPKEEMATAISIYYMSQQIGVALGVSLSSTLLKRQFQYTLRNEMATIPDFEKIISRILADSSTIKMLPETLKNLVSQCYLKSFWVVPTFVTVVQALAVVPMISTTDSRPP